MKKQRKAFYKRWWFWVLLVVIVGGILSSRNSSNKNSKMGSTASQNEQMSSTNQETKQADQITDSSGAETSSIASETSEVVENTSHAEETSAEPTETIYVLSAGSYKVGVDIPAGRATVTPVSGQGNVMDASSIAGINAMVFTDSNGKASMGAVFESYTLVEDTFWYISQTAVVQLEYTSITKPVSERKYADTPTYSLVSGLYTVGTDIEPGAYRVDVTAGTGNYIAGNYMTLGSKGQNVHACMHVSDVLTRKTRRTERFCAWKAQNGGSSECFSST